MKILSATLLLSSLSLSLFANDCGIELLSRSDVLKAAEQTFNDVVFIAQSMEASDFDRRSEEYAKNMLDKGHRSWRDGYRAGLIKKEKNPDEARYKPLPNKPLTQELYANYLALPSDAAREQFLQSHKYRVVKTDPLALEQDINQEPDGLFPLLHKKLNGVHENYARVLIAQLKRIKTEDSSVTNVAEVILNMSNAIHVDWMKDASWKVKDAFVKIGIPENDFWGLPIEEIIAKSEAALAATPENVSFTEEETAALAQFTSYDMLSEANQILDDRILLDHLKNYLEVLKK